MVHASKIGGFTLALVFGAACGSAGVDEDDPSADLSPADGEAWGAASTEDEAPMEVAEVAEVSEDEELATPDISSSDPAFEEASPDARDLTEDGTTGARTRYCQAVCQVTVTSSGAICPHEIVGHGTNSGLFPGCGKACKRARADAERKLGAGCELGKCTHSGC